jgi:O-antigen ligase
MTNQPRPGFPAPGFFSDPVNYTGVFSVFLFALCAWLSTTGAGIAMIGFLLAFVLSPAARSVCRRDPVFWMFVPFAAFIYWSEYRAIAEFPETAHLQHKEASNWLKIFAFFPFAWWLRGDLKRIQWVLALALAGLVAGNFKHFDWEDLLAFDISVRSGFKFVPAFTGLISTTALLGLLLFARRIWYSRYPWITRSLWLAAIYVALFMLLASQARAAWLAAGLIIPAMLVAFWFHTVRDVSRNRAAALFPMGLAIVLLLAIVAGSFGPIQSRLKTERHTAKALLHGQRPPTGRPSNSLSKRYQVQVFGFQKWLERPLLGWGPGTGEYLIAHSDNPELRVSLKNGGEMWLTHFHNTYLESLVRLGVVGAALLSGVGWVLGATLIGAARRRTIPYDQVLFLGGSSVLLVLWSLFDFRATHTDWRAYWIILAGIIYSCRFKAGDRG